MTVDRPWFYPDCVSAQSGDAIRLFASAPASPCTLVVSRVGKDKVEVARFEGIVIDNHPIPDDADTSGCDWPECFSFTVVEEWQTGYYDLTLTDAEGRSSQHFICVRKPKGDAEAKAALILSTNTYAAYNYWGGRNAYADVMALVEGKVTPDASRDGAIAHLSRMRPYPQGLISPPGEPPRLINYEPRDVGQMPIPGDLGWAMQHRPTPYDGSACFLKKWEHIFAIWAEEHGYDLDYLTDHDFERDPKVLSGYDTALVVGHSEYWSGTQRFAVEDFIKAGGNFVSFSGNTCYWKVRWENDGTTLVAHKWAGEENDPLWADPATREQATHLWSHPEFSAPEARFLGLSFLYGGYHRIGMCAARGSAAYTIYNDEHWALEDTDLYYGDVIGGSVPLIGYENDGCPIQFGDDGLPKPGRGLGVPVNLEIIAMTPATLAESDRSPFPKIIPLEDREILTRVTFGEDSETNRGKLMRGHAVMASLTCGLGEVFNAGTTEWVHGLAVKDPFVTQITQNVLNRFGVRCNDHEKKLR